MLGGLLTILAACTMTDDGTSTQTPPAGLQQIDIDERFTFLETGIVGRPMPGYVIAYRTVIIDDRIAICGAFSTRDPQQFAAANQILGNAHLEYEGQRIMRGFRYFNRAPWGNGAANWGKATCRASEVAAPGRPYTVFLRWPAQRVNL